MGIKHRQRNRIRELRWGLLDKGTERTGYQLLILINEGVAQIGIVEAFKGLNLDTHRRCGYGVAFTRIEIFLLVLVVVLCLGRKVKP